MSNEDDDFASIPVSKPSIFEIVAHEAVAAVFRPAFHYVFKILAQKYPEKLSFALKCADEIYMLCDLVIQRHYLSYYNASLSENFYYLKRVDMLSGKARPLSTKSLQNLSLITQVVLPYIKAKMDKTFENIRDRVIRQEDSGSTEKAKLTRVFLKIYPFVHFALEGALAFYKLGYVLNLLEYHSPLFHALRIQLVRASSEDLLGVQPNVFPSSGSFLQKMVSLPGFLMDTIIKSIAFIMPAVIFSLQFVEWWYSTEHEITSSATRLPIPPPPEPPKVINEITRQIMLVFLPPFFLPITKVITVRDRPTTKFHL